MIERLARSGIKNLLVEGGGKTLGAFIEANLLDEIYCTLCPWILGGGKNPSFVNISEIIPWKKLEIIDSKRVKNEIYLHYKVKKPKKSRKRRTP